MTEGDVSLGELQAEIVGILESSIMTPSVVHNELTKRGYAADLDRQAVVDVLELMRERGRVQYNQGEFREYTLGSTQN